MQDNRRKAAMVPFRCSAPSRAGQISKSCLTRCDGAPRREAMLVTQSMRKMRGKGRIRHTPVTRLDYPSGGNAQRHWRSVMSKSKAERFRIMAAECERQAQLAAAEEAEFRELQNRLAHSFHAHAENEDWLDGSTPALLDEPRETLEAA
jgi:hypothetical protein